LKGLFSLSKLRGFHIATVFLSDENWFEYAVPGQSSVHTNPHWPTQFLSTKPLSETLSNLTWKFIANFQNPRSKGQGFGQLKGLFLLSKLRGFHQRQYFSLMKTGLSMPCRGQSGVHTNPYWSTQFSSMKHLLETLSKLTCKLISNVQNPRYRYQVLHLYIV